MHNRQDTAVPSTAHADTVALAMTSSADLYVKGLGTEKYEPHHGLFELIKNGISGSMGSTWDPGKVHIDIQLVKDHPLGVRGTLTTSVLDRGFGITKDDEERLLQTGMRKDRQRGRNPLSQKGLGVYGAFALHMGARRHEHLDHVSFKVLSRVRTSGPITVYTFSAKALSERKLLKSELHEDSPKLGHLRGIKGSFTCVIIPESYFTSPEHIRTELRPLIPLLQNNVIMDIAVHGKILQPLDLLVGTQRFEDHGIVAYLKAVTDKEAQKAGVVLLDAQTGIHCTTAVKLRDKIPYPFGRPDLLEGVIYLPGIIDQQEANRQGLNAMYLASPTWKRIYDVLDIKLGPRVRPLLGDRASTGRNDLAERLCSDVAGILRTTFGIPAMSAGPVKQPDAKPSKHPDTNSHGQGNGSGANPSRPHGNPQNGTGIRPDKKNTKNSALAFQVDGRIFQLEMSTSPGPTIFCQASEAVDDTGVLLVNPEYLGLNRSTTREVSALAMLMVLQAAAAVIHPTNAEEACLRVQDWLTKIASRKK